MNFIALGRGVLVLELGPNDCIEKMHYFFKKSYLLPLNCKQMGYMYIHLVMMKKNALIFENVQMCSRIIKQIN